MPACPNRRRVRLAALPSLLRTAGGRPAGLATRHTKQLFADDRRQSFDVAHQPFKLFGVEGLGPVRQRLFRLRVYLDGEAVRPRRDRRKRRFLHEGTFADSMAGVNNHRQVGQALYNRNRRNIEGIAGIGFKRPDAALT